MKRVKTKYPGVYKNNNGKYDIVYSYKVYDPVTDANLYKQKWKYGFESLAEAHDALVALQNGGVQPEPKEITLQGAFDLWKQQAQTVKGFSEVTIRNTQQHMNMIASVVSLNTKMKAIDADMYLSICQKLKDRGYSAQTLYSLNSTLRKLIRLCYRKKLITENVLEYADNFTVVIDHSHRIVTRHEFDMLNAYFRDNSFVRMGVDTYPMHRFILHLLYFTGCRIGEILALTPADLDFDHKRISITKSYASAIKTVKEPKNFKHRGVPMANQLAEIAEDYLKSHEVKPDERIFAVEHGAVISMLKKAAVKVGIDKPEEINCHGFRHTYISNLLLNGCPVHVAAKYAGDTVETIMTNYAQLFGNEDEIILEIINNL